jgi:hypothetical protein
MFTELGMSKHRKSGHSVNCNHFTGKKGSGTNRKQKKTRKQKRKNKGSHVNKYAEFSVAKK